MSDPASKAPVIARVFMSGSSQAVRLPRDYRFACSTVSIRRDGNALVLTPIAQRWEDLQVADGEPLSDELVDAILDDSGLLELEQRERVD